jgi:transposase
MIIKTKKLDNLHAKNAYELNIAIMSVRDEEVLKEILSAAKKSIPEDSYTTDCILFIENVINQEIKGRA